MATIERVPLQGFTLVYENKDITKDIAPYAISVEYTDTVEDKSSSIEIQLEDEQGLWKNEWYPQKGDRLQLFIGDMDCGNFEIDQNKISGPPDIITISALDNILTKSLHTKKHRSHEGKTLKQIAQAVANVHGLKLVGNPPAITLAHVSQRQETDLKFLRRISYDFGVIFHVRDGLLVYESLYDIDKKGPVFTIDKTQITSYSLTDKTSNVFKNCVVGYHDPATKKVIKYTAESADIKTVRNNDGIAYREITSGNTLFISKRVENQQQAEAVAKSELYRTNSQQQSGSISAPGKSTAVSGNNFELTGLGVAGSGIMNIQRARHSLTRSESWVMDLDFKRVAVVSKQKQKGTRYTKPKAVKGIGSVIETFQNKDNLQYRKITPIQ